MASNKLKKRDAKGKEWNSQEFLSRRTKMALLFFNNNSKYHIIEFFILLFEYLQLISQALLLRTDLQIDNTEQETLFFQVVIYCAKLINPAQLLNFSEETNPNISTTLLFVLFFTLFKYTVFAIVIISTIYGVKTLKLSETFLRRTTMLQGRIIYYFISSFWVQAIIKSNQDDFTILGLDGLPFRVICSILVFIEYLFSITVQALSCYTLPTKSFLSSKDHSLQFITITEKLVLQILIITLPSNSVASSWVLIILNLVFDLVRNTHYFTRLPQYRMTALFMQGYLLMIVTSLHLASFSQELLNTIGEDYIGMKFLIIIWIISSLFLCVFFTNLMNQIIFKITIAKKSQYPKRLVHKVHAIKELRRDRIVPTDFSNKYSWSYLMGSTIDANLKCSMDIQDKNLEANSKASLKKAFTHYIEKLKSTFPKNGFIQLYCAYYYGVKLAQYGKAMRIISELPQSKWSLQSFNISLLLSQIQKSLKQAYYKETNKIDLLTYIQSQVYVDQLKSNISKQAESQINICKEIINETPNLSKITKHALSADSYRKTIERIMKRLLGMIPEYYIEPLLICAHYQFQLNYSPADQHKFLQAYKKKTQKFDKYFKTDKLIEENFYQKNNAFFMVSGQRHDAGKIMFCTKSVEKILGGDFQSYSGSKISSLFLLRSEAFNDEFFKETLSPEPINQNGESKNFVRTYVHHKEGHIVEVDYYINIYPVITQGFYFSITMRQVHSQNEFLILHENGDIEGATKKIAKLLRLHAQGSFKQIFNVSAISPELSRVNFAFNQMDESRTTKSLKSLSPLKQIFAKEISQDSFVSQLTPATSNFKSRRVQKEMSRAEATDLFNVFATEGKILKLSPICTTERNRREELFFNCTLSTFNYGAAKLKLVRLAYTNQEEEEFIYNPKDCKKIAEEEGNKSCESDQKMDEIMTNIKSDSAVLSQEDEKKSGWIDFEALTVKRFERNFLLSEQDNLVSPTVTSPGNLLLTHKTKAFSNEESQGPEKLLNEHADVHALSKSSDFVAKQELIEKSIAASKYSISSSYRDIMKEFKLAVTTKYYSKPFKIFSILCYIMMIALLLNQIITINSLNNAQNEVLVKTNILSYAQLRTFNLAMTQSVFRNFVARATGRMTPADYGLIARPFAAYINSGNSYISNLSMYNTLLLQNANSLTEDKRSLLYQEDVRIFETENDPTGQTFTNMTSFEATTRIIQMGLKEVTNSKVNVPASLLQFKFLFRNALNDLYIKNNQIASVFFESVILQVEDADQVIDLYLIVSLLLIGVLTFVVGFVIWSQYSKDKRNMESVVRLDPTSIKNLLFRLQRFNRSMKEGVFFEDQSHEEDGGAYTVANGDFTVKHFSQKYAKDSDHSGLRKAHIFFTIQWFILALPLVGLIILESLTSRSSLDVITKTVKELSYSYDVNGRVNIITITATELAQSNGTALVQNVPTAEGIYDAISDLKNIQKTVWPELLNGDIMNNPEVKEIVSGDACPLLIPYDAAVELFCNASLVYGNPKNVIELLSYLEDIMVRKKNVWEDSDKSPTALYEAERYIYPLLTTCKRLLSNSFNRICAIIYANLTEYMDEFQDTRQVIFKISICYLVFVAIVLWILILRKLKEGHNNFKKVLKSLPAEIVLSSFLLKHFLIKTSREALNVEKYGRSQK